VASGIATSCCLIFLWFNGFLEEGEFFALHETLAFSTPYSLARKFNSSIVTPHIQIGGSHYTF